MTSIYDTFIATVRHWNMLVDGDHVLVGVSGGADSVALLHLLLELRRRDMPGLYLHVCHLNHSLRGYDADCDEDFVRNLAATLQLPCSPKKEDVRLLSQRERIGLEEAARRVRYEFYGELAREYGITKIALGHQADDNIETMLFRLRRGTHLRGLAGIPFVRPLARNQAGPVPAPMSGRRPCGHAPPAIPLVIRPLLRCTRAQIRDYLLSNNIAWREDASNRSLNPARNRIRHELMPMLEREAPGIGRDLQAAAEALAELRVVLAEAAHSLLCNPRIAQDEHCFTIPLACLETERAIVEEVFWQVLKYLDAPLSRINRHHFVALERMLHQPAAPARLDLPGTICVERRQGLVSFSRKAAAMPPATGEAVMLPVPGEVRLPALGLRVCAEASNGDLMLARRLWNRKSNSEEWLDDAKCHRPLQVRPWQAGDRFHPLGAPGVRKLQDFLTDAHVPATAKGRVAVVLAAGQPIWVVGHRIDERAKVDAQTRRLLHLQATPI